MAAFDVIVCGSLHLDILVKAPALPRIDETAVGTNWEKLCGGKGGNQAIQAANAGARVAMLGRVGNDDFGRTLRDNLAALNVDVSAVSIDPALGSGMSVAILQNDGDYGAVIVSGSNLTIEPSDLPRSWKQLGEAKILVLQNEVPHAVNVAAALVARSSGAKVVLNAAPARDLGGDLLDNVDVLIVNRVEAEAMFGKLVKDRASARHALASKGGKQSVVITLGGDGLIVLQESGEITEILPLPVKVTSSHGAGDCFVGALAAQLASGVPLVDACAFANRCAAAYVSRTG